MVLDAERLPAWVTWQRRPFPDANLLLLAGRQPALVDSGFVGHAQETAAWTRAHTRQVALVVNTHWHSDHVGGNGLLQATGAGIAASAPDAQAVARRDPGCCQAEYLDQPVSPYTVDAPLDDGQVLGLGDGDWQVIRTPGHTPGHLSLWQPEERLLVVGRHPPRLAQDRVPLGQGRQAAVPEDPGRPSPVPRSRDPRPGRGTSRGSERLTVRRFVEDGRPHPVGGPGDRQGRSTVVGALVLGFVCGVIARGHCCIEPEYAGEAQQSGGFPSWNGAKKGSNHSTVPTICRLWAAKWRQSHGVIAQCNSALRTDNR
jgi:Metallo-beta-lactamase superfamily